MTNCRGPHGGASVATRKAVELEQSRWAWQALGWAHYRTGRLERQHQGAGEVAADLDDPKGGDAAQWFFLAMAHWRLGEKDKGREMNTRAVRVASDKNQPKDEILDGASGPTPRSLLDG